MKQQTKGSESLASHIPVQRGKLLDSDMLA